MPVPGRGGGSLGASQGVVALEPRRLGDLVGIQRRFGFAVDEGDEDVVVLVLDEARRLVDRVVGEGASRLEARRGAALGTAARPARDRSRGARGRPAREGRARGGAGDGRRGGRGLGPALGQGLDLGMQRRKGPGLEHRDGLPRSCARMPPERRQQAGLNHGRFAAPGRADDRHEVTREHLLDQSVRELLPTEEERLVLSPEGLESAVGADVRVFGTLLVVGS